MSVLVFVFIRARTESSITVYVEGGNTFEAQCRKMYFPATAVIRRDIACFSTAGLVGSPWTSSRLVSHQPKSGWSC